MSANPSTSGYPFLTSAAANLINAFAADEHKKKYLPAMFDGRFSGTMAMTEPDTGSSLGDLTTKATPHEDGSYRIRGQKMYISGGDQDITENIVHLVLARIEGAPQGAKGISLFIVPKIHTNDDGSLGEANDVKLVGLLHKMGYRGTTSTVLQFGDNNQCQGFLIGEANHGLKYMFKMMNNARLGVGVEGLAVSERSIQLASDYAQERRQGRAVGSPAGEQSLIIDHADVRRMLLTMRAYTDAMRGVLYLNAACLDIARNHSDEDIAQAASDRAELLTPISKGWCTDTIGMMVNTSPRTITMMCMLIQILLAAAKRDAAPAEGRSCTVSTASSIGA